MIRRPGKRKPVPLLLSMLVGIGLLAVSATGGFVDSTRFFRSYLFAYLFWLGISLGAMGIVLIHHLTGGRWGFLLRRPLEAAFRVLPLLAVLLLPLLLGLQAVFVWAIPEVVAETTRLHRQQWYLNPPFLLLRTAAYFGIWLLLAFWLSRWSAAQDERSDPSVAARLRRLSAAGLLLYTLTLLFFATDWIMSIKPEWRSTVFPLLVGVGQLLGAMAFGICCAVVLARRTVLSSFADPRRFVDLGNLLLMLVLTWMYLAFSQYMIIWYADLPAEITWYLPRVTTSWSWLGLFLIAFHFAVPVLLLLFRRSKQVASRLGLIAAALLPAHLADTYWLVMPMFEEAGFDLHWLDITLVAGLGGLWAAGFLHNLERRPLLPTHAPRIEEAAGNG